MGDEQNGHGKSRLDRLEGLMQILSDGHLKFNNEHDRLLRAQVSLDKRIAKLDETMRGLDRRQEPPTSA